MNIDSVLNDAITYVKMSKNENYKERLLEAYYAIKQMGIKDYESFEQSSADIGAFTYNEITIFDRLMDEKYTRSLAQFCIKLNSSLNIEKDYGDRLASFGKIGDTPYREELIKKGYITTGLTEEEKNRFYR